VFIKGFFKERGQIQKKRTGKAAKAKPPGGEKRITNISCKKKDGLTGSGPEKGERKIWGEKKRTGANLIL